MNNKQLARWYKKNNARAFNVLRKRLFSKEDIEDAMQEAYIVIHKIVNAEAVESKNPETRNRLIISECDRTKYFIKTAYYICLKLQKLEPIQAEEIESLAQELATEEAEQEGILKELVANINDSTRDRGLEYADIQSVWRDIPNCNQRPYKRILELRFISGLSPGKTRRRLTCFTNEYWSAAKFSRECGKACMFFQRRYMEKLIERAIDLNILSDSTTLRSYLDSIRSGSTHASRWAGEVLVKGRSLYDVTRQENCSREDTQRLTREMNSFIRRARLRLTELIRL